MLARRFLHYLLFFLTFLLARSPELRAQEVSVVSACFLNNTNAFELTYTVDSTCGIGPDSLVVYRILNGDTNRFASLDPSASTYAELRGPNFPVASFFIRAFGLCGDDTIASNVAKLDDNAKPAAPVTDSISYTDDGLLQIAWQPVSDTDVVEYNVNLVTQASPVLLFETLTSISSLDSVFSLVLTDSLLEAAAAQNPSESEAILNVAERVARLFVLAVDECGNESFAEDLQTNLFISNVESPECASVYRITSNNVQGLEGAKRYEALLKPDDADTTFKISLGAFQSPFELTEVPPGAYQLRLRVSTDESDITQRSNALPLSVGPEPFEGTTQVEQVRQNGENFQVDVRIQGFEEKFNYFLHWQTNDGISNRQSIPNPREGLQTLTASIPNAGESLRFWVSLEDDCERTTASSDTSRISVPSFELGSQPPQISFAPPPGFQGEVFQGFQGDTFTLVATNPVVPNEPGIEADTLTAPYCFFTQMRDTASGAVAFRSDTQCINLQPIVHVPSAFRPNGREANQRFRAFGTFFDASDVRLQIFNRWGEQIYEGEGPDYPWEGQDESGEPAPPGIYLYLFDITAEGQRSQRVSGTVHLLR
jgi:gliding motility-associated-like protein